MSERQTNNHSARSEPNASILSTDSLLSINTTSSTINPLLGESPRTYPPQKDYSAAFSILQSRYGTGGGALPSPKSKPSKKLQTVATNTTHDSSPQRQNANGNIGQSVNSQLTLVTTPSFPSSTTSRNTSTSTPSTSSAGQENKKAKKSRIGSFLKGKGKTKGEK